MFANLSSLRDGCIDYQLMGNIRNLVLTSVLVFTTTGRVENITVNAFIGFFAGR